MLQALENIPAASKMCLALWLLTLLLSLTFRMKEKVYWKPILFLSAISLAAAFAQFVPFLYLWDEQFHALVAKNGATDLLHPKLYADNPAELVPKDWSTTGTWLHKQPLSTWQMAMSVKIFGNAAFAVRLPSVILHGFVVLVVYRIGELVFSKRTGLIAALGVMHAAYLLGLISGKIGTDHNDLVFMSYILFSFWAYFEWKASNNLKWLLLIGVFIGLAVLTKWLVGLLLFFGWGILTLKEWVKDWKWLVFKPLITALAVAVAIFLPWQIYIFTRFPVLARKEFEYNSHHLTGPVEGHGGDLLFHFELLPTIYFITPLLLILFGLGIFFMARKKELVNDLILFGGSVTVIYLFFTLVQTKMPSFTVPAVPLVVLVISFGIDRLIEFLRKAWLRNSAIVLVGISWIILLLKPIQTLEFHGFVPGTEIYSYRELYQKDFEFLRKNDSSSDKRVVFGCQSLSSFAPSWMFFNGDIAYYDYPTKKMIEKVINNGYQPIILNCTDEVSKEIGNDPRVTFLRSKD